MKIGQLRGYNSRNLIEYKNKFFSRNYAENEAGGLVPDLFFFLKKKKRSLKSDSHFSKKFFYICFNDSPSKMIENAFYFIIKALFVLKIFKFLS